MSARVTLENQKRESKMKISTPTPIVTAYPSHVAAEITARRPDLCTTDGIDAIRTTLSWNPTLSAEEAIEIIDEATADAAAEARCDHPRMAHGRCTECDERCTCGDSRCTCGDSLFEDTDLLL